MASCVWNICTKNYQNLIIGFQVTVKNIKDAFSRHSVNNDMLLRFILKIKKTLPLIPNHKVQHLYSTLQFSFHKTKQET